MNNQSVTIITPVYNGEKYLQKYFMYIRQISYPDVQIVLVNDGSTDHSGEMLRQYVNEDKRAVLIDKTYNEGVSAARNSALQIADGDWIFFFDCDDCFESDIIDKCLRIACLYGCDTVLYNYEDDHRLTYTEKCYTDSKIKDVVAAGIGMTKEEVLLWIRGKRTMRERKELTGPWKMMYSMDIISQFYLSFDPELRIGEDTIFTSNYLAHTRIIGVSEETLYHCQNNEGSTIDTYKKDPVRMISEKLKLIDAKVRLEGSLKENDIMDISGLWGGEYLFSSVQIALGLTKNTDMSFRDKLYFYRKWKNNDLVRKIWKSFTLYEILSCHSIRSIPFVIVKLNMDRILFLALKAVIVLGLDRKIEE